MLRACYGHVTACYSVLHACNGASRRVTGVLRACYSELQRVTVCCGHVTGALQLVTGALRARYRVRYMYRALQRVTARYGRVTGVLRARYRRVTGGGADAALSPVIFAGGGSSGTGAASCSPRQAANGTLSAHGLDRAGP